MYATSAEQRKRARVQSIVCTLYRDHYGRLINIAKSNAPTLADAEEALQDAFESFLTHFDLDSGAPPIAWLILTLKRACWTKARRDREYSADTSPLDRESNGARLDGVASDADLVARIEAIHMSRDAMAALKPAERTALGLLGAGYSYKEICDLTGWSYTKVNRCVSEGRAALRATRTED